MVGEAKSPILLLFMERIIGLTLLIVGAILSYGSYTQQSAFREPLYTFFIVIGIVLIILGLIMLISKTK